MRRARVIVGAAMSLAVHGAAFWWLCRRTVVPSVRMEPPIEIAVMETPVGIPPRAPAREPGVQAPRPTRRSSTRTHPTEAPASSRSPIAEAPESHPLMRMRGGGIDLSPGADTLARALGPVEPPPADEKPRRKPRLPGTGLTTLEPEIDEGVKQIHPRFFEVLTRTEKLFRPDRERVADEVRGDLNAQTTIKRWLFGGLGNDAEAMRNQVPTLACLVCVTLRPGVAPEVELSGPSGSPWFDRAATESLQRAAIPERPDDALDPARACYRFAARVWRTQPDLSNLAVPFKLNFESKILLVSYQRLGS